MIRRALIILTLATLPAMAMAASVDQLGPASSATTPTQGLGPTTNSAATSDPGTANILQPANPNALQPAGAQDGGINLPATNSDLQPAGQKDQIKDFLSNETDNHTVPSSTDEPSNRQPWLIALGLVAVLALAAFSYWSNRHAVVADESGVANEEAVETDQDDDADELPIADKGADTTKESDTAEASDAEDRTTSHEPAEISF